MALRAPNDALPANLARTPEAEGVLFMLAGFYADGSEPIMVRHARMKLLRPKVVEAFLNAGGVLWCEKKRCIWGPRQIFAQLGDVIGADVWRPDYPVPEFLPILRWADEVHMWRKFVGELRA